MQVRKEVSLSRCPNCESDDIEVRIWGTEIFLAEVGLSLPVDAIELWDDEQVEVWDSITGMINVDGFAQCRCRDCGAECTFQHDKVKGWILHFAA